MEQTIAVVTGARRGLGLGTAIALARARMQVIVTARDESRAAEAVEAMKNEGLTAIGRVLDVSSDESVDAFFAWLDDTHGRIDVLVNNAGRIFEKGQSGSLEPPAAVLLEALNNNALSAYRTSRRAIPRMNERGHGRIVNVSSGMGALTDMGSGYPAYRVSKTAMSAITRLTAHEARGDVLVNIVCPGWVRTDMGGPAATRDLDEGVASIVWAALLPSDGPNGGFFRDGKPIDW
jgi:NAD(P)-dependent dehydrogenase (short-subunit alcohol dehydrogenase family)